MMLFSASPRKSKKALFAAALDATGLGGLMRAAGGWRGLLILNYHRIGDPRLSLLDRQLFSATTDNFDSQVRLLTQCFDVVSMGDLADVLARKRGRHVMITFDDGYRDNYTDAFAVLRTYSVPATFFVTTGFLDRPRTPWWDEVAWMVRTAQVPVLPQNRWTNGPLILDNPHRELSIYQLLKLYKRLTPQDTEPFLNTLAEGLKTGRAPASISNELWMTWDMVREMRRQNMAFGAHSTHHPVLANLSAREQDLEVSVCKQRLTEELQEPCLAFSYPVGGQNSFNEVTREALARHGYRWGFSYLGGYLRPGYSDHFSLARTAIEMDITLPIFRALVTMPTIFA